MNNEIRKELHVKGYRECFEKYGPFGVCYILLLKLEERLIQEAGGDFL